MIEKHKKARITKQIAIKAKKNGSKNGVLLVLKRQTMRESRQNTLKHLRGRDTVKSHHNTFAAIMVVSLVILLCV